MNWLVCRVKTQISLGIHPVWSGVGLTDSLESTQFVFRWTVKTNQIGQRLRLTIVFTWCKLILVVLLRFDSFNLLRDTVLWEVYRQLKIGNLVLWRCVNGAVTCNLQPYDSLPLHITISNTIIATLMSFCMNGGCQSMKIKLTWGDQ